MTTSRLCGAAAALLSGVLLLTSCGDSGGEEPDEIVGARNKEPSASPDPAGNGDPGRGAPEFDFPADLKVVVDADTTGDEVKDAILRDHGHALRADLLALATLDPELPVLADYVAGDAFINATDAIESARAEGRTVTGETRFYDRTVNVRNKRLASVTYCEDQREAFDKDVETGEVDRTEPSDKSFVRSTALMEKSDEGVWQMTFDQSQRGAPECQL